jgi:hypothetical protein
VTRKLVDGAVAIPAMTMRPEASALLPLLRYLSVNLRRHVKSIDTSPDGSKISGLTLPGDQNIKAKCGVICNAPDWSLSDLIKNKHAKVILNNNNPQMKQRKPRQSWHIIPSTGKFSIS